MPRIYVTAMNRVDAKRKMSEQGKFVVTNVKIFGKSTGKKSMYAGTIKRRK